METCPDRVAKLGLPLGVRRAEPLRLSEGEELALRESLEEAEVDQHEDGLRWLTL